MQATSSRAPATAPPATDPNRAAVSTTSLPPAPTSTLARDLYAVVVHLHKNCNADLFEAVGALELSLTQIKLLHILEMGSAAPHQNLEQDLSLGQAAELVRVSLPATSRMVEDLVRRGLVERDEDPVDRRMKRVRLTEPGRAAVRRINAARLTGLEEFVRSLTDEERGTVAGALRKLLERSDIAACRPDAATEPPR